MDTSFAYNRFPSSARSRALGMINTLLVRHLIGLKLRALLRYVRVAGWKGRPRDDVRRSPLFLAVCISPQTRIFRPMIAPICNDWLSATFVIAPVIYRLTINYGCVRILSMGVKYRGVEESEQSLSGGGNDNPDVHDAREEERYLSRGGAAPG